MAIDLTNSTTIATGLFVRIELSPSNIIRFSDWNATTTINGESYQALGKFVGITTSVSELKNSTNEITITISGLPVSDVTTFLATPIKGAKVQVWRAVFNPFTGALLNIEGNPVGRFFGIVNNFSLDEDYDSDAREATNTIGLVCTTVTEVLNNKVAGRKTNPTSWKSFNPSDVSMDRVPNLMGANFDFGIPK